MRRVMDRNRLIDGGNLLPDGFHPVRQFLDVTKQLGALPFQFLSTLTWPTLEVEPDTA
jgi:hypothetical protein